ncbi:MAG TPA: ATP-binding protein [Candidatus Nanoarchaeia archaeon]|nr:ATP-binding protein [Candidatus Nanoarchaeia archaeon]
MMEAIKTGHLPCKESRKNDFNRILTVLVSDYTRNREMLNEVFGYVLNETGYVLNETLGYSEGILKILSDFSQESQNSIVKIALCSPRKEKKGALVCFREYKGNSGSLKAKIIMPPEKMYAWVVRRTLEKMLSESGFCGDKIYDINHAVSEAYDNAIIHGPKDRNISVEYRNLAGGIAISITDYGGTLNVHADKNEKKERGEEEKSIDELLKDFNDSDSLHIGLPIMRSLADNMSTEVDRNKKTTVRLEFYLHSCKQAA